MMYIHIYIYTYPPSNFLYKMGMAQIPASKIQRVRDIYQYTYTYTILLILYI